MKNEIENLINDFDKLMEETTEKIDKIVTTYRDSDYSDKLTNSGLMSIVKEEIEKITEEHINKLSEINEKGISIVEKNKNKVIHENINKSSDYSLRINNALSFIEAEGDGLTDDIASLILEDFMDDFKSMRLFKSVIENKNGLFVTDELDPTKTNFPKTFKNFNDKLNYQNILSDINENINIMLKIFMKEKRYELRKVKIDKNIYDTLPCMFQVPETSYTIRTARDNLKTLSEEISKLEVA